MLVCGGRHPPSRLRLVPCVPTCSGWQGCTRASSRERGRPSCGDRPRSRTGSAISQKRGDSVTPPVCACRAYVPETRSCLTTRARPSKSYAPQPRHSEFRVLLAEPYRVDGDPVSSHRSILPRWLRREPNRCVECGASIARRAKDWEGKRYRPGLCADDLARLRARNWSVNVTPVGDAAIRRRTPRWTADSSSGT